MAKKKTLTWYRKAAWKVFSEYIRRRDKGICYTCGAQKPWKLMQAGHFLGQKAYPAVRFDELNVHCQGFHCNINLGGHTVKYGDKLVAEHGQEAVDDLKLRGSKPLQLKKQDYIELRELYKQKTLELEGEPV